MLKNRQEGIINLHGLWQAACLLFLFLALPSFFGRQDLGMKLEYQSIYLGAIALGSLLNLNLLHRHSDQFVGMGWYMTLRLTAQQVVRIALLLLAVVFAVRESEISRNFLTAYVGLSFAILLVMNKVLPKRLCELSFRTQVIPTVVIGSTDSLNSLSSWIHKKSNYGIEIVGYISEAPCPAKNEQLIPCLGTLDELEKTIQEHGITQTVIVHNALSREGVETAMAVAQKLGCRLRIYNNWQEDFQQRIVVEHEGDYTFLAYENEPLENPMNRMIKRIFDVAIAMPIVAFVLPPLTLAVWAFQQRQSPGPIFYAQPRTGMTKRPFHIIKFRTMHLSDGRNRAQQAKKGDSRIYAFGAFLRKTSLDEIPQFINVLLGEMSVSGPRPHLIEHDRQFSSKYRVYYTRHFVKPGITGLAQSLGFRGEIVEPEHLKQRIAYDIKYINNWSFTMDLQIMIRTAKAVLFPPKSAY